MVVLDAAARAFVERAAAGPDPCRLTPAQLRARLEQAQCGPADRPVARIEDLTVPGPAGAVRVRLVRPPQVAGGALPVVLYLHGGGWIAGGPVSHDRVVREIAAGTGAAVVFVDYDLAPEAPYPAALHQAAAVARWVVGRGHAHGLDATRMAVAGDSAGGNLAAALTLWATQHGGFSFVRQVLLYPPLSARCDSESFERFAHGFGQSAAYVRRLWRLYVPDPARRTEPTVAPLHAAPHQLAALPSALVITAEADVLRDEGEAYADRLRSAGVPVTCVRYQGTVHAFAVLDALRESGAARAALAQVVSTLREALHPRPESP